MGGRKEQQMKVKKPESNNKAMRYHISYKFLWLYCERNFTMTDTFRITDMLLWETRAYRIRRRLYPQQFLPSRYAINKFIHTLNEFDNEYLKRSAGVSESC